MYLSHPRLLVRNFSDCFLFYRDVMGFKVTWGDENDSYASFTIREEKTPCLALFRRDEMAATVGTTGLPENAVCQDRLVLIVEAGDVDAAFAQLTARGAQPALQPADYPGWGIRAAYIRDPDGNLIELSGALDQTKWSADLLEAADRYHPE